MTIPDKTLRILTLGCAALGALLAHLYLAGVERKLTGGSVIAVLTLTRDLPAGTTLTADMLAERALPERHVESRHIPADAADRVLGLRTGGERFGHEALLWSDIEGMDASGQRLAELIPPGMRALAVGRDRGGLSRLVRPGDRVDVLCARHGGGGDGASGPQQQLLQNVTVLAVGADLGGAGGAGHGTVDDTEARRAGGAVTVAVSPTQARSFSAAGSCRHLDITLRNPDDVMTASEGQLR